MMDHGGRNVSELWTGSRALVPQDVPGQTRKKQGWFPGLEFFHAYARVAGMFTPVTPVRIP